MKQNKDIMCSNQDSSELFGSFLLYFWDKRRLWSFFWNGGSGNIINGVRVHFRLVILGGEEIEGSNTVWVEDSLHNKEMALDGFAQLLCSPDVYGHTSRCNGVKSIQPGMKEEANEWAGQRTFQHSEAWDPRAELGQFLNQVYFQHWSQQHNGVKFNRGVTQLKEHLKIWENSSTGSEGSPSHRSEVPEAQMKGHSNRHGSIIFIHPCFSAEPESHTGNPEGWINHSR